MLNSNRHFSSIDTIGILRGEIELLKFALSLGWRLVPCSCACGFCEQAFQKPRPSGAFEMVGCVEHSGKRTITQLYYQQRRQAS